MSQDQDRRQVLKTVVVMIGGVATTLIIPGKWTRPVVQSIIVPAHAAASPAAAATTTPAATTTGSLSDIRLKRDFVRIGKLDNGVRLYRFRYLWSDVVYVGVMAQEVLPVAPEAVIHGEDGFMRVDYARLGTRMMTWDEWQREFAPRAAAA